MKTNEYKEEIEKRKLKQRAIIFWARISRQINIERFSSGQWFACCDVKTPSGKMEYYDTRLFMGDKNLKRFIGRCKRAKIKIAYSETQLIGNNVNC